MIHNTTQVAPNNCSHADMQIRAACVAEDYRSAVTLLLRNYGDCVMTFLAFQLRDPTAADEAFAITAEQLWHGLPGFKWQSSVRTWAYAIARRAAVRHMCDPHRRRHRNLPLGEHHALSQLVDDVRTRTQRYMKTETKNRMRALREQLPPDDQLLLVLRINRQLSFRDAAIVMTSCEQQLDEQAIEREAARLRKRFERIKAALRRMAERDGLLS